MRGRRCWRDRRGWQLRVDNEGIACGDVGFVVGDAHWASRELTVNLALGCRGRVSPPPVGQDLGALPQTPENVSLTRCWNRSCREGTYFLHCQKVCKKQLKEGGGSAPVCPPLESPQPPVHIMLRSVPFCPGGRHQTRNAPVETGQNLMLAMCF